MNTLSLFVAGTLAASGATMQDDVRTISVSGDAEIKVVPDEAVITLGVETLDKELAKSKKDNDDRMKRIIASAKDNGVEDKRIATDQVSIEPKYEYENNKNVFKGYEVRRTVAITIKDLPKFDAVLSAVLEAGAYFVQEVRFATTELRKHRDHARSLAVKAALEKAQAIALDLNQKVGRPRSITEGSNGWWSSYGWGWNRSNRYSAMSQNVMQTQEGPGAAAGGATAPGMISVNATVSVVFELQ